MRSLRFHRPSPTMLVAFAALLVAMGGTSYAAFKLPKNSVGSPQIKANAIGSSKVKNGALRAVDFGDGQLPVGPRGYSSNRPDGRANHLRRDRPMRGR
jgi:hypothetical protein